MKVNENVKIKENIKRYETANAVEAAADMIINMDENGVIRYEPYYTDFAIFYSVVLYLMDGVEFEDDDNYETIQSDEKVNAIVKKYLNSDEGVDFRTDVDDVVRYRQRIYLSDRDIHLREASQKVLSASAELNEALKRVTETNIKLLEKQVAEAERTEEIASNMTPEEIADLNKLILSGKFDMNALADRMMERFTQQSQLERANLIDDGK